MRVEERRALLMARFSRLDLVRRGWLDRADPALAARRLSQGVGRPAGCNKEILLAAALRRFWETVSVDSPESVCCERFASAVDQYGKPVGIAVQACADAAFGLADLDGDNRLNLKEYAALCLASDVPDLEIIDGFEKLAPGGLLMRDRFRTAALEYWLAY